MFAFCCKFNLHLTILLEESEMKKHVGVARYIDGDLGCPGDVFPSMTFFECWHSWPRKDAYSTALFELYPSPSTLSSTHHAVGLLMLEQTSYLTRFLLTWTNCAENTCDTPALGLHTFLSAKLRANLQFESTLLQDADHRAVSLVGWKGGATTDTRCFLAIKGAKSLSASLVVSQAIFSPPRDERRPTTVAVAGASGRCYSKRRKYW